MNKATTLEERIEIMEKAQEGYTDQAIATHLKRPLSTVRKWRRRGQGGGREALASTMGRPRSGALSTYPQKVREQLYHWRKQHPGWGPQTLRAELSLHPKWSQQGLPSVSSIARFLKEQGLTRPYEHHQTLPQVAKTAPSAPHEVWEMDARGYETIADAGVITLININDRFSHARILSYPCQVGSTRWQRHANTEDYQMTLRLAFTDWGLPQSLQVDHGSVFIDNNSKSPFPTRFHLWVLALGVVLAFGRPARPRDQAITERSHQLWDAQCLQGQHFVDWQHLYHTLRQRRHFLNHTLPCRSLNGQAPLQAFPQACYSQRPYRPEWETKLLDMQLIWDYLAQGRWFRNASKDGTFSLGGQVYYLGLPWARVPLEITFDAHDQHLNCNNAAGELIARKPIQGITIPSLMGNLYDHFNLPAFQLALPFPGEPQTVIRLFDKMVA